MYLESSNIEENEILKKEDLEKGLNATIGNIRKLFNQIYSPNKNLVIGGEVIKDSEQTMAIRIKPLIAYNYDKDDETGIILNTQETSQIGIANGETAARIDLIEINSAIVGGDVQQRAFMDFETKEISYSNVPTINRLELVVNVNKGVAGSGEAPTTTEGFIKLAEIKVPAGATVISQCEILNISADYQAAINENWTTDRESVYNPESISTIRDLFRVSHTKEGKLKDGIVKKNQIDTSVNTGLTSRDLLLGGTLGENSSGTSIYTELETLFNLINTKNTKITITDKSTPYTDDDFLMVNPNETEPSTIEKRKISALWTYIQGKISSVLGLTSSNYKGLAAKATNDASGNTITSTYATKTELTENLSTKQDSLSFDDTPTKDSSKPVKSGGVYSALGGKAPTSHASSATSYGVSSESAYGHAKASSTTPKANGTASVGTETAEFARGDHVHPAQTTITGNAATATKLATAKTIKINLGSDKASSFDGTANITPGVEGTLPVANGGTGATTQMQINKNIATEMVSTHTAPNDVSTFVMKDTVESNTPLFCRTALSLWTYIQGKISSVLGLTSSNYKGLAANSSKLGGASLADVKKHTNSFIEKLNFEGIDFIFTSNISLSGTDGWDYPCSAGDTVLCVGQTDKKQNGLWITQTGSWNRPGTHNINSYKNKFFYLTSGYYNTVAMLSTELTSYTAGTTELEFVTSTSFQTPDSSAAQIGLAMTDSDGAVYMAQRVGTDTVGATNKPIYLNKGSPSACSSTVGSASIPVYMNAGTITKCTSISLNAASATKLQTARTITIRDNGNNYTGSAISFNGTANITLPLPASCKFTNLYATSNLYIPGNYTTRIYVEDF